MTEPRPAKKLRDYIPLHESINRGPLLLAFALFALAGIVAAIRPLAVASRERGP